MSENRENRVQSDVFRCLVLSDQQPKTQRDSVYCDFKAPLLTFGHFCFMNNFNGQSVIKTIKLVIIEMNRSLEKGIYLYIVE